MLGVAACGRLGSRKGIENENGQKYEPERQSDSARRWNADDARDPDVYKVTLESKTFA
jgi:hypothetical protein